MVLDILKLIELELFVILLLFVAILSLIRNIQNWMINKKHQEKNSGKIKNKRGENS